MIFPRPDIVFLAYHDVLSQRVANREMPQQTPEILMIALQTSIDCAATAVTTLRPLRSSPISGKGWTRLLDAMQEHSQRASAWPRVDEVNT